MKNYVGSVAIKLNDCEVGVVKVFGRDIDGEFARKVALSFFGDKYDCEIIEVKEN